MPTSNGNKIERRSFAEVRTSQGDEFAITGYACLFNNVSKDLGGFREIVAPGAFDASLKSGRDVQFCFNHSQDNVLARTSNGTLTLSSDDKGLKFRAALNPKIQSHRDIWEACRSGLYNECSYAFKVKPDGDKWSGSIRTLVNVDLFDVSLVGQPAYSGTSASARSAVPSTEQLRARLAKIDGSVFAGEDQKRRDRAAKLTAQINRSVEEDPEDELDDNDELLNCLQRMCNDRYGANRHRVVDYDCSERECSGTAYARDMLSDTEDFFAFDFEEDPEADIYPSRALKPQEVSAYRGKRLRLVGYRRRVSPSGTTWSKTSRAVRTNDDWFAGRSERDLKRRMESASR